ncbi:MAG: Gfo/Idh/MocA family oxidoreductase [Clostridia bacterium]|nr:Gfo/Idh/MocA family oxidoreductase [Clostridia bacterium]
MSEKIINFAIVGCGAIADFHAQAIKNIENARLIGACDKNIKNAESFTQKYGIKCYESFEQMLCDKDIDAVCICTPSLFHKEGALAALRAGKHVVIEKPMAFTKSDAEEIAKAVESSNKVLTSVAQLRFSDDFIKAKALIENGELGRLLLCDLYMKYWRDESYYASSNWKGTLKFDGGGALMNQGIHGIDALLYLVGDAKVVCAKNKTVYHDIEVEDMSLSMLEFDCGAMGVIEGTTCIKPGFERKIEIMGTKGALIIKEDKIEKLVLNGKTIIDNESAEVAGTASDPTAMSFELHRRQLTNFIGAINEGRPLVIDVYEGARPVSLIEEIYNKGKNLQWLE